MTIHHLQNLRYSRGLVRVEKVVIIGERNPPLWQNCRPVLWQWMVSVICHVFSSVRGLLRFSITGSWPVYLFYTFMMGRSLLQGWILYYLRRWFQRLPGYRMWERCGPSANCCILFILSHMSGPHLWVTCQGSFLSDSSGRSMLRSCGLSCITLHAREDFHRSSLVTFACWCTLPEWGWWTSRFSSSRTFRGCHPCFRDSPQLSSIGVCAIMVSFSSLFLISWVSRAFYG